MSKSDRYACDEYNKLSRRNLLIGGAALVASGPLWMPKIAFATDPSATRDRLICINLNGGSDGLSFCAPVGDPHYAASRPNIAVPTTGANAAIDIDGYFAFPKAFQDFTDPFNSKHMAVLHAVGRQNWTFSHFDAGAWMAHGSQDVGVASGWLARHLSTVDEMVADAAIRTMNFSDVQPLALAKADRMFTSSNPSSVKYGGTFSNLDTAQVQATFLRQYLRLRDDTKRAVRDGVRATDMVQQLNIASYAPASGVIYDNTEFGNAMKATAAMMKADIGIEVFHADIRGWDTHVEQGTTNGLLATKMENLATNVTALYRDLMASNITNWTIVIFSEFGRRINENGGHGCEHGEGNTMLVLSPNLATTTGGKVKANWPGIAPSDRTYYDGLRPTLDDRDVWCEILKKRLNNQNTNIVFPNFTPTTPNILFPAA